jgi:hypothetical protein
MPKRMNRSPLWNATDQRCRARAGSIVFIALLGLLCTVSTADAQTDLSGEWVVVPTQANVASPEIGEYVGLPLNEEARRRAEIWNPAIESLPEWQCRPPSGASIKLGPSSLRIRKEIDPTSREIVAFEAEWLRSASVPIYLDGRPHPPEYARHTWGGFSTATWLGDALKINTTHLKEGYYRSNGVPQSDRATLTEYLMRRRFRGQDYLTWVVIADDPVYLTEPLVRSGQYRLDLTRTLSAYPCSIVREAGGVEQAVPSYFPGTNDQIHNFAESYALPPRVESDGAATMYPEYRDVLMQWRARGGSPGSSVAASGR